MYIFFLLRKKNIRNEEIKKSTFYFVMNKGDKCILQIVLDIKIISYIINQNFEIPQKNQDKRDFMYNRETKSVAFCAIK